MLRLAKPKSVWRRGEDAAARFMKRSGCIVLARNLRLGPGEIDLLCRERRTGTIVVVEVKAREYDSGGRDLPDPTASITARKQAKLRTLVRALQKKPEFAGRPIRIDIISVRLIKGRPRARELKHYRSAVSDC